MGHFESTSIRAAWRADFNEHLPLTEEQIRSLHAAGGRRSARALAGLRSLFTPLGRFRRDLESGFDDQPRAAAFAPPL